MTNSNLTHIGVIIDRSGSMYLIKKDTEGGLSSFIEEQKKQPGDVRVSLAQFDNEYELVYDSVPLDDVKYQLRPRGATALHDAIGRFVTDLGENFANQKENDRPDKVIVLIMTDGMENSSVDWNNESVKKLITQQQDEWSWEFVFMGANIDSITTAKAMGIATTNSIDYGTTRDGVQNVFAAASSYVSTTRSGLANTGFTQEQREAAADKSSK